MTIEASTAAGLLSDGKALRVFGSSDYLGLSRNASVRAAIDRALNDFGPGLPIGTSLYTTTLHVALEEELADFLGVEMVALFSSGAVANLATVTELARQREVVVDSRSHSSLVAAAGAAGASVGVLSPDAGSPIGTTGQAVLIASDGLFAINGELADLVGLSRATDGVKDVIVLMDDAHAIGTVGTGGRGTRGRQGGVRADLITGSFSKALGGGGGGFVAGRRELVQRVAAQSPYFWATSRPSPLVVASALAALRVLQHEPHLVSELEDATVRLRQALTRHGVQFDSPPTAITPVRVGSADAAKAASKQLRDAGFFVPAITPPVVAEGQASLRLQSSVLHTAEIIDDVAAEVAIVLSHRA